MLAAIRVQDLVRTTGYPGGALTAAAIAYGAVIVLGGRLVPGLRSVVSLPAGLVRMPLVKFTALTAIGSLVWNALLIAGGWALGSEYGRIADAIGPVSTAVAVVLVVCALLGYIVWSRRRSAR